jgi:hypothetical protein
MKILGERENMVETSAFRHFASGIAERRIETTPKSLIRIDEKPLRTKP